MGTIDERSDEMDELRQRLAHCEQEREQVTVALEDAHAEVQRLSEQLERLQTDNAHLARSTGELARFLNEHRASQSVAPSRAEAENSVLTEELQVTVEELQVTAEELEEANTALRQLNIDLERRVEERTAALRKTLAERDALLDQKDMLAREIDHRVKNSLQMVASLLHMQSRGASDETRQALQVAMGRIHAVARVHALLYAKGYAGSVGFKNYLHDICANLADGFGIDQQRRALVVEADPVQVSADVALSLATVVNELVTNALWYAFAPDQAGTVWVQFRKEDDGRLSLTVADDGRGLPETANTGLGTQIVSSIAEGLKADVAIGRTGGTRITLTLPPPRS
jgi:Signal transduction histidine kinase